MTHYVSDNVLEVVVKSSSNDVELSIPLIRVVSVLDSVMLSSILISLLTSVSFFSFVWSFLSRNGSEILPSFGSSFITLVSSVWPATENGFVSSL